MFKFYSMLVGLFVGLAAWFGFVVPRAVSSTDNLWVTGSILLSLFVVLPFAIWFGWRTFLALRGVRKTAEKMSVQARGILQMLMLGFFAIGALSNTGCARKTVPAGHVGVKVDLYGKQKGVEAVALGTGRYWINPLYEEIYVYPTFQTTYPFTKANTEGSEGDEAFVFQNKDGVECNVDIAINAWANAEKAPVLFQTYREDMLGLIKTQVRNRTRDLLNNSASAMSIEDLYSTNKIAMILAVEKSLKSEFEPIGLQIGSISTLSNIRFPPDIEKGIVAKIAATQEAIRRQNEVAEATAAAQKMVEAAKGEAQSNIERARGEAEANRIKAASLSPMILAWQRLQNEQQAIKGWNGKLPQYNGISATPFIDLNAMAAVEDIEDDKPAQK